MNTRRNWSSRRRVPPGKGAATLALLSVAAAFLLVTGAAARPAADAIRRVVPLSQGAHYASRPAARAETLWIFDADFEDLLGDNAGWLSEDRSGTLAIENYWHHDTIRMHPEDPAFDYLGDSTWWCGTYNDCWRQPRGYGNDWYQILERHFDETLSATTSVILEFDQRYAMEADYDYGYVDVRSSATADTWFTVEVMNNWGFTGTPGRPVDWDTTFPDPGYPGGHVTLDITSEALGVEFDLRFRFESDGAYSSQDQWDNSAHSVLDGAWQLDNITIIADGSPVFVDDAESGDPWSHEDVIVSGQTGVTFWRGQFGIDFITGRGFTCDDRPVGSWMYAAVDPFTSKMVDGEYSWLISPPIDVSGAAKLVGQWDMWVDLPRPTEDVFNLLLASNDQYDCVTDPAGFMDESPGAWYGGPFWSVWTDDWDAFAGNDWLAIRWDVWNSDLPEPGIEHMGGIFLNRQRVGIPSGDAGTTWSSSVWDRFNDWFQEQMAEALLDTMHIGVQDDDGIASVTLLASNDGGQNWSSYTCRHESWQSQWWYAPPPSNEMTQSSEIWYYFEAMDGVGNTAIYPPDAPDHYLEMSILPIHASVADPGLLLVDKHGALTPGEDRQYGLTSEDYFREALDILGYEYDVYDVEVPSGSTDQSDGPDSMGYKYYDTQIWFTSDFSSYTIKPFDQQNLIAWLSQSEEGKERNLLFTGNDIASGLGAADSLGFLATWLATEYLDDAVGDATVDSVPGLRDFAGGFEFMTHDDRECVLRGGCPELGDFDVIQPYPGVFGAELVAEYVKADMTTRPAGVAYTDSTGYQTVTLGFGMEFMSDVLLPTGHYAPGVSDRADLMANIMEYFQRAPTGPGTGTEGNEVFVTKLSQARPNPFNPSTTIAYSLAGRSRVTIRVYDLAGRIVRTLVEGEADPGEHVIVWDGTTDSGKRAASGVYFVKMEGRGDAGVFSEVGKAVMLK